MPKAKYQYESEPAMHEAFLIECRRMGRTGTEVMQEVERHVAEHGLEETYIRLGIWSRVPPVEALLNT